MDETLRDLAKVQDLVATAQRNGTLTEEQDREAIWRSLSLSMDLNIQIGEMLVKGIQELDNRLALVEAALSLQEK